MKKPSDYLLEQQIFLGGQVSHKHKVFMDIASMSPDYADIYFIMEKMPKWDAENNEDKVILEMLKLFGSIDFVRNCSELTKLSMILGDSRSRINAKSVMEQLRKTGSSPTT